MGNLRPPQPTCNPRPNVSEERQAIIAGFALVLDGVMSIASKLAARQAAPAVDPELAGLIAKADAARALGISPSTLDRHGAPFVVVGTRRRYDLPGLRAWFAARGRQTAPTTTKTPDVDVGDVLARSGLRSIGGGK